MSHVLKTGFIVDLVDRVLCVHAFAIPAGQTHESQLYALTILFLANGLGAENIQQFVFGVNRTPIQPIFAPVLSWPL